MTKFLAAILLVIASPSLAGMIEFRPIEATPIIVDAPLDDFAFGCANADDVYEFRSAWMNSNNDKFEFYGDRGCLLVFNRSKGYVLHVEVNGYLLVRFTYLAEVQDSGYPLFLWVEIDDLKTDTPAEISGRQLWNDALGR